MYTSSIQHVQTKFCKTIISGRLHRSVSSRSIQPSSGNNNDIETETLTRTACISTSSMAWDGAQRREGASQNSLKVVTPDDVLLVDFGVECDEVGFGSGLLLKMSLKRETMSCGAAG